MIINIYPSEGRLEMSDTKTSLGHTPTKSKWEFDKAVTEVFEDMLKRSIPQYPIMRRAVFDLGRGYVKKGTTIVDMGASRGDAIAPFISHFGAHNHFALLEISEPMLKALDERFRGYIETSGIVRVIPTDLRHSFPPVKASLILSILTLQFTPIEYRMQILQRAYDALVPGGALIIVEKVLGETAAIDDQMVELYLEMKREGGYSQDEIDRKRASLEGVLVPVSASFNERFISSAGFRQIDCFWRWMNFAGWVAIK